VKQQIPAGVAPALAGRYDSSVEAVLDAIKAQGFPGWANLGVDAARMAIGGMTALAGPPEPVRDMDDLEIPGLAGNIPARLYIPEHQQASAILIYLHGGGWVIGNPDTVDAPVRALANRSGIAVLSVDYRLAPEHPYPAALDDAYSALLWAAEKENLRTFGFEPGRILVGGDSAGGNLAAALTLRSRETQGPQISFALLIYPALDCDHSTKSHREFGSTWGTVTTEDVSWFHRLYMSDSGDLQSPYVSPLRADDLSQLPPAFIVTAEMDPLCDEQTAYVDRLRQCGVRVEQKIYAGMCHGFFQLGAMVPTAHTAIDDAAAAMRAAI
jgi:acetyl esterase